jgi:hypothetical protein
MTTTKMYVIQKNGSSSNASLIYNFDNVSKVPADNDLSTVKQMFDGYVKTISKSFQINSTQLSAHQISYYDNLTNSTILYSVEYLHVCPTPVTTSTTDRYDISDCLCIILQCRSTDVNSNTLLIIIPLSPIKYTQGKDKKGNVISSLSVKPETNINNLTLNIKNNTNLNFDINAFIPSSNFNTYISGNNKFIYTTEIKYDYQNLESTFNSLVPELTTKTTPIYENFFLSSSAPSKQNILVKNDIYIDCYKVGESSKIKGGIINPLTDKQANKEDKREKKKNKGITILTTLYFVMLAVYLLFFTLIHYFYYNDPNTTLFDKLLEMKQIPISLTGFYALILLVIIFSM